MLNVKKLLTKILSRLTDSGWVTSLGNGIQYRKKNGTVYVTVYSSGDVTLTTTYKTLATLPTGYRPTVTEYTAWASNASIAGTAYIDTSGIIGAKTYSSSTAQFWFQFSYPVTE